MTTDSIGLYVHVPFCKAKCNYCDFVSFSNVGSDIRREYLERLCEEIRSYRRTPKIKIDTVFFGGGTPSTLLPEELSLVLKCIHESFEISEGAEITLEANPKTLDREKLLSAVLHGVNRVSLGLQSIHENELKTLGRIHSYEDFLTTLSLVRSVGITNINVDLMYGIPHQTKDSFRKTLDAVIALDVPHISAYGLIIEEGTPFFEKRDELPLPSEDDEADMYEEAIDTLLSRGYSHYEISNYARSGFECRHNLKYWRDEEYIGVGIAAHSYFEGKRYSNPVCFNEYLSEFFINYRQEEIITKADEEYEYAMMRLRLKEGIDLLEYSGKFGKDFFCGREAFIDRYISAGILAVDDGRLHFTDRGFYLSNTVLSDIL